MLQLFDRADFFVDMTVTRQAAGCFRVVGLA